MLSVARLQSWEGKRYAAFANEALNAFPYHYNIAFEIANAQIPKWGGSVEALESFARNAVHLTEAKEGQSLYARIYWNEAGELGDDLFDSSLAQWPAFKAGFDDIIKRYPESWNLNSFARFACMAKDSAKAKELLARIGSDMDGNAWKSRDEYQACVALAAK
jgi:hypothetical protein